MARIHGCVEASLEGRARESAIRRTTPPCLVVHGPCAGAAPRTGDVCACTPTVIVCPSWRGDPWNPSAVRLSSATGILDAVETLPSLLLAVVALRQVYGGDMSSVIVIERRSLLMKEILDEAAFRDQVRDDLAQKR